MIKTHPSDKEIIEVANEKEIKEWKFKDNNGEMKIFGFEDCY